MKKQKVVILMLGILLCCGGLAQAVPITIAIAGNVSEISDPFNHLHSTINVGDAVEGVYIYDSGTEPVYVSAYSMSRYNHSESPYGMDLQVGDTRFYTNPDDVDFSIHVVDNGVTPGDSYFDWIDIWSYNNLSSNASLSVGWMRWLLYDSSHEILTNTDLPLTAPVLDDWTSKELRISEDSDFYFPDDNYMIKIQITSAVAVPEPTSILFFLLGAVTVRLKRK